MIKSSMIDILENKDTLNDYIISLENDIDSTKATDEKVDEVLNNILENFDNFKDRRALRASNISAVTELLRLKAELPQKRIQHKKTILDIMAKKEELEIKKQTANAASQIAENSVNITTLLLNSLDINNVQPDVLDVEINEDCSDVIDTLENFKHNKLEAKASVPETESKEIKRMRLIELMREATNPSQIFEIQNELEALNQSEENSNG